MVTSIVVPAHFNNVPKYECYSSYYIPAKMTEYYSQLLSYHKELMTVLHFRPYGMIILD